MPRPFRDAHTAGALVAFAAACTFGLAGCTSLLSESASTSAGIGGTAIAGKITHNPTVASGIGLGVLAAGQAGVQALERDYHGDEQDRIAAVAGALDVGQVAHWESHHRIEIDPDQSGRVTVSRLIGGADLRCKEIVFTVDAVDKKDQHQRIVSAFYVATICKDAATWRWATAEPATSRWGSLQ